MNNLKKLRKEKGMGQVEMAKMLGIGQSTYSRYEAGLVDIPLDILQKLTEFFGVSSDIVLGLGTAPETFGRPIVIQPELTPEEEVLIPVMASLRCGFNSCGEPCVFSERKPVPVSWTRRWGKNIVFVEAVGDSMIPTIQPGDLCVCIPGEAWESGNIVVVDINDSDTIKRIRKVKGGIDLVPDNPAYEVMHLSAEDIDRYQVRVLGRIVKAISPDL
jgi:repressor LexA